MKQPTVLLIIRDSSLLMFYIYIYTICSTYLSCETIPRAFFPNQIIEPLCKKVELRCNYIFIITLKYKIHTFKKEFQQKVPVKGGKTTLP
jgi:hypothetical protein